MENLRIKWAALLGLALVLVVSAAACDRPEPGLTTAVPTGTPSSTPTVIPTPTPMVIPTPTPTAIPITTPSPTSPSGGQPTEETSETDRATLVVLYHATDGDNWAIKVGWLSDAPIGEWYGVATDSDGRVTAVALPGNWLSGQIPPELGKLTNLRDLYLQDNQLSGEIPPELGKLVNLESLILAGNQLSGEIPSELLDRAATMENFDLSRNRLDWSGFEFESDVAGADYVVAICNFAQGIGVPETWGDLAATLRAIIDFLEENEPPNELRDYFGETVAGSKLLEDFVKEKDPNVAVDPSEMSAFQDGPEFQAVEDAVNEAEDALDPELQAIMDNVCS